MNSGQIGKIYKLYWILYKKLFIINEHEVSLVFPEKADRPSDTDCNDGRSKAKIMIINMNFQWLLMYMMKMHNHPYQMISV